MPTPLLRHPAAPPVIESPELRPPVRAQLRISDAIPTAWCARWNRVRPFHEFRTHHRDYLRRPRGCLCTASCAAKTCTFSPISPETGGHRRRPWRELWER